MEKRFSEASLDSENPLNRIDAAYQMLQEKKDKAPRLPDSLLNEFWKGLNDKLAAE